MRSLPTTSRFLLGIFTSVSFFLVTCTAYAGDKENNEELHSFLDGVMRLAAEEDAYRSMDGHLNNFINDDWGMADTPLLRKVPSDYGDGISTPSGGDRPNQRDISNAIASQYGSIPEPRGLSDMIWQWGQFVDHDISLSAESEEASEFLPIPIPTGDQYFDPYNTGTASLPFHRSVFDETDGGGVSRPREQMNAITSFIDGSNVYGSSEARGAALRTFSGGRLKTSGDDLLPRNVDNFPNAGANGLDFVLAGDPRANEQTALTAMHTLWVREHNHWADLIAEHYPNATDEEIFQMARRIVVAEMQAITMNEFLPALFGRNVPTYKGYKINVPPMVALIFSTAAFRVGHTTISPTFLRVDDYGYDAPGGEVALRDAFFVPNSITDGNEIGYIMKGLASQKMQKIDTKVIDDLRNFLFGPPGAGGLDLVSLNLQRGRDHGLPPYNDVREAYGFDPVKKWSEITSDRKLRKALKNTYGDIDKIDPWIGLMSEDHAPGASIGTTLIAIIEDQFLRLRDGDRLWYENSLSNEGVCFIEQQTLAKVIKRNTQITNIQDNVFFAEREYYDYDDGGDVICSVGFSPSKIAYGEGATLWWWTEGAEHGSFDREIGEVYGFPEGNKWIYPKETGVYTMKAWGPQGESYCEAYIEVEGGHYGGEDDYGDDADDGYDGYQDNGEAPYCSIGFAPEEISKGEGTTLWWWSEGAKSGSINNGIGEIELPMSDMYFYPENSGTYTLTLWNDYGETTCSADLKVNDKEYTTAPYCAIGFAPAVINKGEGTTLWWWSMYGDSAEIDRGMGSVNLPEDDIYFYPEESGDYTFTVRNGAGEVTCDAEVTVR